MTAKPPAFQWYPKECDTDENVRMMNDSEFGFFVRCLNHAWLNDGLPDNAEDIGRALGRPTPIVEKYWIRVGKCFTIQDGRNRNAKQELQRKEASAFIETKKKAANARWNQSRSNARAYADALRMECPASASASASAKVHIPEAKNVNFLAFQKLYESSGKALNEGDWRNCAMVAVELNHSDQYFGETINPYIQSQLSEWRAKADKAFVPFPASLLKKSPWTRVSKPGAAVEGDGLSHATIWARKEAERIFRENDERRKLIERERAEDAASE